MLIKVLQCSDNLLWYNKFVNKYFEVVSVNHPAQEFIVKDNNGEENIVLFKDAEEMKWK